MRWLVTVVRIWGGRPPVDLAVAGVVWLLAWYLFSAGAPATMPTRQSFLQVTIGILVAAIAFSITGASVLFAVTPGPRLRSVMGRVGYQFTRLVMGSVLTLLVASAALAVLMLADSGQPHQLLFPSAFAVAALGLLAELRLVWLFSQVFSLLTLER